MISIVGRFRTFGFRFEIFTAQLRGTTSRTFVKGKSTRNVFETNLSRERSTGDWPIGFSAISAAGKYRGVRKFYTVHYRTCIYRKFIECSFILVVNITLY